MRGYPQFSFWISKTLVKIYLYCIIINQGKNTYELVGTVLKSRYTEILNNLLGQEKAAVALSKLHVCPVKQVAVKISIEEVLKVSFLYTLKPRFHLKALTFLKEKGVF